MSQENVGIVRGFFDDYLGGETPEYDTEGALTKMIGEEVWDPNIEWDASNAPMPDISGVYRGRDAVRRWWQEWLAAWENILFEYELIEAGDRVVALINQRMRGRSTGIEVPVGKYAQVFRFRDGFLVHWKLYMDQSEALEALGLSEQDVHADS
jgi:ketosteroid isomerase-like protein